MTTTLIAALFGIAFISTVVTTPVAKWFGQKLGLVDHPDDYRKVHRQAIPLGGGFAVFLGFVIPIVYFFQSTTHSFSDLAFLLGCSCRIGVVVFVLLFGAQT